MDMVIGPVKSATLRLTPNFVTSSSILVGRQIAPDVVVTAIIDIFAYFFGILKRFTLHRAAVSGVNSRNWIASPIRSRPRNFSIGMITLNPVAPATFARRQKIPIGATFMTSLIIFVTTALIPFTQSTTMVFPDCFVYMLIATPNINANTIHGTILPSAIAFITFVGTKFKIVSCKDEDWTSASAIASALAISIPIPGLMIMARIIPRDADTSVKPMIHLKV